jgi:site-specific DNA-cytosine methylase
LTHENGRTLQVIISHLDEVGYIIKHQLLDAVHLVPQERNRIFIVGVRKDLVATSDFSFEFPKIPNLKRGFQDVYQIDGGIVKYGEEFADDGLWEGSLRVFDNRMTVNFSDKAKTIGECTHCQGKTSNFENCAWANCNDLVLVCEDCKQDPELLFHTVDCREKAQVQAV